MTLLCMSCFDWGGVDYATPKCATSAGGLFQTEDNLGLADSGRAFNPLLKCLKEFRWETSTRKSAISRDNVFFKLISYTQRGA